MQPEPADSTSTDFVPTPWDEALRKGWPSPEDDDPGAFEVIPRLGPADLEAMGREMVRLGVPTVEESRPQGRLGAAHPNEQIEPGGEPVPGYRLVERLGAGASGEVWKAIGPGGIAVALKVIRLGEEEDRRPDSSIRRARRDGLRSLELMRDVRHANLLTLFGAWYSRGRLIIGMELADGTLMDRALEANAEGLPGIPLPELLDAMRQAARGIDFLNESRHALPGASPAGIQHRDIKPQNLLKVGDGVKVGDFGQARLLEEAILNTGCLTPAYAAPEFFQGRPSNRSDQYSLAVTYCRLRGGGLPFTGTRWEVMKGHCLGLPDLSMLPEAERPPIARSLEKDPARRWPDCRSLVEALASAAAPSEVPVEVKTTPPDVSRSPNLVRGLPNWAAASLLLAVVLTGLAALQDPAPVHTTIPTPRPAVVSTQPESPPATEPLTPLRPPVARFRTVARPLKVDPEPEIALMVPAGLPLLGAWDVSPSTDPPRLEDALRAVSLRASAPSPPTTEVVNTPPPPPASPRTATIHVLMPIEKAVLYIPNDKVHMVGLGNPDDWYGPHRVIHTKPLAEAIDFEAGAFWTDARGRQLSRIRQGQIVPGRIYQLDLRSQEASWTELGRTLPAHSQPPASSHP